MVLGLPDLDILFKRVSNDALCEQKEPPSADTVHAYSINQLLEPLLQDRLHDLSCGGQFREHAVAVDCKHHRDSQQHGEG